MQRVILLILFISTTSLAGSLSIPLNQKEQGRPAEDLVLGDELIDSDQALDLVSKGEDLSQLEIEKSAFWIGKKLPLTTETQYPAEKSELKFHSFPKAPTEIFRASLDFGTGIKKKRYTLNLSLDNHAAVLRAGLLRLMGYQVELPKIYKQIIVNFSSETEKKEFLLKVSEQTLTGTKRWVLKETETSLTLKTVVLEPAKIETLNAYWGVMLEERQETRRSFRALLAPFLITNYVENVNLISWELGQVFNKSLILSYPYAEEFTSVTLADLHWSLRKLARLTRKEWQELFALAGYPENVRELILEKTISRLLSLVQKSKLKEEFTIKANSNLMLKHVVDGKLLQAVDPDNYALIFYDEDPENPFRIGELFRFFRIRLFYGGLSTAIEELQNLMPLGRDDAFKRAQEKIDNGSKPFLHPISVWTAPYISGRLRGSRSVVFGQFRGADAPIQIVDSMALEFSAGLVGRGERIFKNISPGGSLSSSLIRTFTHIKAVPDIKTANDYEFKNLYIPGLLKRTGSLIDNFICSVRPEPHVIESEIDGETFYSIRYQKDVEGERERALELRTKIISEGTPEERILLAPIDRVALCEKEEVDHTDQTINQFLENFSNDETFAVTDELRVTSELNANVPINVGVSASVRLNAQHIRKFLRAYIIRKKDNGFEVVWNRTKTRTNSLQLEGRLLIRLLTGELAGSKHNLKSDIYFIDLKNGDIHERKTALAVLKILFTNRNSEVLEENYDPIKADHDLKSRYTKLKFLLWGHEKFRMQHDLSLKVIDKNKKEMERTFHTNIIAKRSGRDNLAFASQVLGDLTSGLFAGLLASETPDPGQSLWGRSSRFLVYSEVETTPEYQPNMITQIQWGYKGSGSKPRKIEKIFRNLESKVGMSSKNPLIDRGNFKQMTKLKSYDIQANLLIYPGAHERLWDGLSGISDLARLDLLAKLYGVKKYKSLCEGDSSHADYIKVGKKDYCAPFAVKDVYKNFEKLQGPLKRQVKTAILGKVFYKLFNKFDVPKVLHMIGKKNWFYNIRVTGFRSKHASGYINYISDTLGDYDGRLGTGILDFIGKELQISSYELKAMRFTPGFQ